MSKETAIKITDLSKKYRLQHPVPQEDGSISHELWVLKDLNLEIAQGESIGIVGPNGSGKSTLLKILAGVTKPTSGSAEIYGKVASILDIGAGFHPELSGRENVYLSGQLLGFSKKQIKEQFDEIVDFSGIEKFIDEPVKNYSAGMYLRLAFSIILQINADIYLFDEVLSVGDEDFRRKSNIRIREKITQGATSITVSHEVVLLTSFVTKLLRFPSLDPIFIQPSFKSQSINDPNFSGILIEDLQFTEGKAEYLCSLLLQGVHDTKNLDVVFLFSPMDRMGEDFALSSLHPERLTVDTMDDAGKIKFESTIPKKWINSGKYSISVQLVQNKNNIIKAFQNCLSIRIQHNLTKEDRFFDFYPGSIRLQTDWNIKS
jgi:lipopolysaccharide transport system ATP-binding protein